MEGAANGKRKVQALVWASKMGVGGGERGRMPQGKSETVCEDGCVWREAGPAELASNMKGSELQCESVVGLARSRRELTDSASTLAAVLGIV